LPTEIGQCAALQEFRIHSNALNGTLPTELALCKNMSILYLSYNFISGTIPTEFGMPTLLLNFI
jgi:hypothetical protein